MQITVNEVFIYICTLLLVSLKCTIRLNCFLSLQRRRVCVVDCTSQLWCENGGTCIPAADEMSKSCSCTDGWKGNNCENIGMLRCRLLLISESHFYTYYKSMSGCLFVRSTICSTDLTTSSRKATSFNKKKVLMLQQPLIYIDI